MEIDQSNWAKWAEELVDRVVGAGASDAEVSLSMGIAREVSIRDGEIEKAETAESRGVSLRAYVGQQTAATSFSFNPDADLSEKIADLVLAAGASPADPYCGLAPSIELGEAQDIDLEQYDSSAILSVDALRARADEMAGAVRKDLRVDQAGAQHGHYRDIYAASNGHRFDNWRSYGGQSIVSIYEGRELVRDYASDGEIFLDDMEAPSETGIRAAERTWAARNPIRPPSGKFPIMFDERISSSLLGSVLGAMSGASIARRASWLIDYDEDILPRDFVFRETPFRKRRLSSRLLDGEGLLAREQDLIKDGRPQLWITNQSSARQLEQKSSGHASRSGVNTGAGISGSELLGPTMSRAKMLKDMGEGLLVTGFIGATINPHTGDYSRGVNGFWVRGGEICEAVNEATIAGNLKTMLPSIRMADDADHKKSTVVGSLLVEEMTIAGA